MGGKVTCCTPCSQHTDSGVVDPPTHTQEVSCLRTGPLCVKPLFWGALGEGGWPRPA